jgi:hypothetical protein
MEMTLRIGGSHHRVSLPNVKMTKEELNYTKNSSESSDDFLTVFRSEPQWHFNILLSFSYLILDFLTLY